MKALPSLSLDPLASRRVMQVALSQQLKDWTASRVSVIHIRTRA